MSDSREGRLADVLVRYSTRVAPGDLVLIEAPALAAPLVRELYARVLGEGAHPLTRITLDGMLERLLLEGTEAQLDWLNPAQLEDVERADVRIALDAPANTKSRSSVDPARLARYKRAREPRLERQLERAAAGAFRSVASAYPTSAAAQDAEMSLSDYADFVYRAGFLDRDDPIAAWRKFAERLEQVAAFLRSKRKLRVLGDGTDLSFAVDGREWIPSSGSENFPDGEVYTAPVETSVEGEIRFSYPAVFDGREVEDVRLRFRAGEVVEASAARGGDFLEAMLAVDEGARRAGEFAFGLNDAITVFTRDTLFDEKIGGTVHLALGAAFPECGGSNRSALHWDMVCDLRSQSEVYADGELVYRDGSFLEGVL